MSHQKRSLFVIVLVLVIYPVKIKGGTRSNNASPQDAAEIAVLYAHPLLDVLRETYDSLQYVRNNYHLIPMNVRTETELLREDVEKVIRQINLQNSKPLSMAQMKDNYRIRQENVIKLYLYLKRVRLQYLSVQPLAAQAQLQFVQVQPPRGGSMGRFNLRGRIR